MENEQLQAEIGIRIPLIGAVAAQLSSLAIVVCLGEQRYPTFLFSKFSQAQIISGRLRLFCICGGSVKNTACGRHGSWVSLNL